MTTDPAEKRFDELIREREENPLWDRAVARAVMDRRRASIRRRAAVGSGAAALAAAAVVFALLPFRADRAAQGAKLDEFVNAQITGTWHNGGEGPASSAVDVESAADMDALIDETLSARL